MKIKEISPSGRKKGSWLWFLYFLSTIVVLGGLGAYLICLPLYAMGFFWPASRRAGDAVLVRGIHLLMSMQPWLSGSTRLSWPEELIPGAGLAVSNHRSHLEAFLLLSRIEGLKIFAKRSLFRVPFLGIMMSATRQIPVDRRSLPGFVQATDEMRRRLRAGERVHAFPEMTRCSEGYLGSQSFSLAPFHVALQERVPVLPIVFKNTDGAWPKGTLRLRFRARFEVITLEPLFPSAFSSANALRDEAKRRIDQVLAQS